MADPISDADQLKAISDLMDSWGVPTTATAGNGAVVDLTTVGRVIKLASMYDNQRTKFKAAQAALDALQATIDSMTTQGPKLVRILKEAALYLAGFEQTADLRQRIITIISAVK